MNDLSALLREHDPARGVALATEDGYRIRAAMLAAEPRRRFRFLRPLAAALMALLVLGTITFGVVVHRANREPAQPRRVEYKTPGGTRVIWTLDPSFRM
jgi:hypothetical protein